MSASNLVLYLEVGSAGAALAASLLGFLFPRVGEATRKWREEFDTPQKVLAAVASLLAIGLATGLWYWVYLGEGNAVQVAKVGALAGIALLILTLILLIYQIDTIRSFVIAQESDAKQALESGERIRIEAERLRTEVENLRTVVEKRLPVPYEPEAEDDG
jgi:hypothetical protein